MVVCPETIFSEGDMSLESWPAVLAAVLSEASAEEALISHEWVRKIVYVGVYIVIGAVLVVAARFICRNIVRRVEDDDHATLSEREKRARTLASVFNNFVLVVVGIVVVFLALQELGVNVLPLLAGAGLAGFAIAFSAQNFIKDIINGFFILMENQFQQGDVVQIGGVSGVVERITLRSTRIRGLDGALHFIPNNSISRVTNMTHGWSGVMFAVAAACRENPDRAKEAVKAAAAEVAADDRFKRDFLDEPQVVGPLELGGSSVTYRLVARTKPFRSEEITYEMRNRIKAALDGEGIEVIRTS